LVYGCYVYVVGWLRLRLYVCLHLFTVTFYVWLRLRLRCVYGCCWFVYVYVVGLRLLGWLLFTVGYVVTVGWFTHTFYGWLVVVGLRLIWLRFGCLRLHVYVWLRYGWLVWFTHVLRLGLVYGCLHVYVWFTVCCYVYVTLVTLVTFTFTVGLVYVCTLVVGYVYVGSHGYGYPALRLLHTHTFGCTFTLVGYVYTFWFTLLVGWVGWLRLRLVLRFHTVTFTFVGYTVDVVVCLRLHVWLLLRTFTFTFGYVYVYVYGLVFDYVGLVGYLRLLVGYYVYVWLRLLFAVVGLRLVVLRCLVG